MIDIKKKALIVYGGWDGHQPVETAHLFKNLLEEEDFDVQLADTLDVFLDKDNLESFHLIIPHWTMGEITGPQEAGIIEAIASGTGLAGVHGGMCDAFRNSVQWQFMTGGQWVSHPGCDGVEYSVNIKPTSSPITSGLEDFSVKTEHYYLHVDPAVSVLATTRFPLVKDYHISNGQVDMPVVWTKHWGHGRVFYNALGHHTDVFDHPTALEITRRGFLWAAEGKDIALANKLNRDQFKEVSHE